MITIYQQILSILNHSILLEADADTSWQELTLSNGDAVLLNGYTDTPW